MREGMIEITGVDLVKFAQKAYELSVPQGLGFMHFTPRPLDESEAKEMICMEGRCPLSMDYVHGRACKLTVFKEDNKLFVPPSWYDHTDEQFRNLLEAFGIKLEKAGEHGCACNCVKCQAKQRAAALQTITAR